MSGGILASSLESEAQDRELAVALTGPEAVRRSECLALLPSSSRNGAAFFPKVDWAQKRDGGKEGSPSLATPGKMTAQTGGIIIGQVEVVKT